MNARALVWFSCGAASAVAAKYAVQKYGHRCRVFYCDTGGEHPDNKRFLKDIKSWIDHPIEIVKNPNYKDHFDVCEKTRYISGPYGARCTIELKKKLRHKIEHIDDVHVFGYTLEEKHRVERFEKNDPHILIWCPLIENNISKSDCLAIIDTAGIELPAMYKLGYDHNNCIGCVKGKAGYWNKIRKDFPEQFKRMAKIEREVDKSINRDPDGNKIFLDKLNSNAGNYKTEQSISCGLFCQLALINFTEKGESNG